MLAQEIPPPKPPFIASAPDPGDWTLLIKESSATQPGQGGSSKSGYGIVEVHSTQVGKVKRDIITYAGGAKQERWFAENVLLWKGPDGDVIAGDMRDAGPGTGGGSIPSVPTGFPGLAWLSVSNYDKVVPLGKRSCYHFSQESKDAWIDVETKLPVASKFGDLYFAYTFNSPPSEALKFPAEYQKTWDQYQARLNRAAEFQKSLSNNQ
ncbi:hypothetical protein BH09VER1_BH09VER1_27650 [soil metagenome]